jgi:hypothetical protein
MELTSMYGDEALSISAMKKWRTYFLQRKTELEDYQRSGRPANSDLKQVIADLIRERPVLSCKIVCRHLRVPIETCLTILHKKLGLKKFHLRGVPDQLIPKRT